MRLSWRREYLVPTWARVVIELTVNELCEAWACKGLESAQRPQRPHLRALVADMGICPVTGPVHSSARHSAVLHLVPSQRPAAT